MSNIVRHCFERTSDPPEYDPQDQWRDRRYRQRTILTYRCKQCGVILKSNRKGKLQQSDWKSKGIGDCKDELIKNVMSQ